MNSYKALLARLKQIDNVEQLSVEADCDFFYLIDNAGTAEMTTDSDTIEAQFSIENPQKTIICILPIDGKKGILGYGDSYCDAVIFNREYFCFLEFKMNATSLDPRAVSKNRKKAINQLTNTIEFFDQKLNKNYQNLKLEAIVATPDVYPRADTAWQSLEVEFLEQNKIPLFEDSKKRF